MALLTFIYALFNLENLNKTTFSSTKWVLKLNFKLFLFYKIVFFTYLFVVSGASVTGWVLNSIWSIYNRKSFMISRFLKSTLTKCKLIFVFFKIDRASWTVDWFATGIIYSFASFLASFVKLFWIEEASKLSYIKIQKLSCINRIQKRIREK